MKSRLNVAAADHPLHAAFMETLRDPRLARPAAHLYDVATWRVRALAATLPSDRLASDYSCADLAQALAATNDPAIVVALCAAGRIRFPDDLGLLVREAEALQALGFREQAQYRLNERTALGGDAVSLR